MQGKHGCSYLVIGIARSTGTGHPQPPDPLDHSAAASLSVLPPAWIKKGATILYRALTFQKSRGRKTFLQPDETDKGVPWP